MNKFTLQRRIAKATITWGKNIGLIFLKKDNAYLTWDFVGEVGRAQRCSFSDEYGLLLYLGGQQFYSFGLKRVIEIHNEIHHFDKHFIKYEDHAKNKR